MFVQRTHLLRIVALSVFASSAAFAETHVRGVVSDAQGKPVSGADVWAVHGELVPIDPRTTTTDASGAFDLRVEKGEWSIRARSKNAVGKIDRPYGFIKLEEGKSIDDLRVTLAPGTHLHGAIQDRDTDAPLPHARLWLDEGVLLEADDNGNFDYAALTPGNHYAYPIAPGYARTLTLFDTTLRDEARVVIRTPRGGTMLGSVRDDDGRPIAKAIVWRPGSGHTIALQAGIVSTDEKGIFELPGVPYYKASRLEVMAPGFIHSERGEFVVTPKSPELNVDFVLHREAAKATTQATAAGSLKERELRTVTGAVNDGTGAPVAGATVRWLTNALDSKRVVAKTAEDGTFQLEGLFNIQSALAVVADGFAMQITPLPADVTRGVEIALEPQILIHGRVVTKSGKPVRGVKIIPKVDLTLEHMFETKWFDSISATSNENGIFELTRQPKTGATYDFLCESMSDLRGKKLDPTAENEIKMDAGGGIRGKVVDAQGRPVTDYRILIQIPKIKVPGKPGGGFFAGYEGIGIRFSNPDGEFVVSDLAADQAYRVVAVAEGYADAVMDPVLSYAIDELPPAADLVLHAGPPTPFRVRVTDATTESPIEGSRVQLLEYEAKQSLSWGYNDQNWERWIETHTEADGQAKFNSTGMPEGTMLVRAPGYGRRRVAWKAAEGRAEVALGREAVVEGVAADSSKQVLAQGQVHLSDRDGNDYSTSLEPEEQGRFSFSELPAGKYSLSISRDNQKLFATDFELQAGQRYRLDVDSLAVMSPPARGEMIAKPPDPLERGAVAPPFEVEGLNGGRLRLEDQRGKFVLLDFWATWCGPCIAETPYLKKVFDKFKNDPRFVMIGLSLDNDKQAPVDYVHENACNWLHGFLGEWSHNPVTDAYKVWAIPSIFLIGPDGKIVEQGLRGDAILAAVDAALGASKSKE